MKKFRWLAAAASVMCVSSAVNVVRAADGGLFDAGTSEAGRASDAASDATLDGAITVTDAALAPPTHYVGKSCKQDGDCAPGLVCLTSATNSLGNGGPAGGMCTVSCAKGQADCNRVDTGSICARDASGAFAYCYEACSFGVPAGDVPKCHDRVDFACVPPQTGGSGFCAPTCRGDFDCPGRACDPASGLCASSGSGNLPVGAACDPAMTAGGCLGVCATLGNGMPTMDNSFCTSTCTLGRPGACGQSPMETGPQAVGCIFKFTSTATDGDLADCGQLCDCDSDCKNPGFICHDNTLAPALGHKGACVPKLTFDGVTQGMPCGAVMHPREISDAGAAVDAAVLPDAGSDASVTAVRATGGCSCRSVPAAPGKSAPALLALLVALGLRRRNARR